MQEELRKQLALIILQTETGEFEKQSRLRDNIINAMLNYEGEAKALYASTQEEKWEIGKEVIVTKSLHGHEFHEGEKVKIVKYDEIDIVPWLCTNGTRSWWLNEDEGYICK
mgnify:CR=1 FL=1